MQAQVYIQKVNDGDIKSFWDETNEKLESIHYACKRDRAKRSKNTSRKLRR